ncbi:hypothetical protein LG299_05200 [Microbacterium lacus]|uniref:NgoMIV family type II restriction endonuclease n=1 Tax=Microbacterium lacus TaxID=415217 RepID=UPI00384D3C2B
MVPALTAPFAAALCGFRANGNPNTSDSNDSQSIELGIALFDELGVVADAPDIAQVGSVLERRTVSDLVARRPDLEIRESRSALEFDQYEHLAVFRKFSRAYAGPGSALEIELREIMTARTSPEVAKVLRKALAAEEQRRQDHELVMQLAESMPEESMLRLDVTVGETSGRHRLLVGLSSKWSLRTDRAQDCISQGAKLVNLRRGRMPHYAVLTMEPRPSMLRLIAYGSGAVDCVYHLALPELRRALKAAEARRKGMWAPRQYLERMVRQGRIRDYDDLVQEIGDLPAGRVAPSK